jgi:hypothetical protein
MHLSSHEEARGKRRQLEEWVVRRWPGTEIERLGGATRLCRPDGALMTVDFSPASQYDAACEACEQEGAMREAWVYEWGSYQALFWDVDGGGVVFVGEGEGEFLVQRSWLTREEDEEEVRALVDLPGPDEGDESGAHIFIKSGCAVLLWAPTGFAALEQVKNVSEVRALAARGGVVALSSEDLGCIGTALVVQPGLYQAAVGSHEDEEWSCRWCRLRAVSRH